MKKILFVYNADSGFFSTINDFAHKIISPDTYECNLCAITYGNLGMNQEWKDFVEGLNADVEFLHKDELKDKYAIEGVKLPVVFVVDNDEPRVIIDNEEINSAKSIEDLKKLVKNVC